MEPTRIKIVGTTNSLTITADDQQDMTQIAKALNAYADGPKAGRFKPDQIKIVRQAHNLLTNDQEQRPLTTLSTADLAILSETFEIASQVFGPKEHVEKFGVIKKRLNTLSDIFLSAYCRTKQETRRQAHRPRPSQPSC